jgi:hypothetical protein
MRVTEMTKFIVTQAAAENNKSKQQIIEDVICAAFPSHKRTYEVINKGAK